MKYIVRVAPPNSIVLVVDRSNNFAAHHTTDRESGVSGTSEYVAIGTLSAQDGETLISLTDEERPAGEPAFDGELNTPNHTVTICSILLETIVEGRVTSDKTRVMVWTNDPVEPDTICVFLQPSGAALVGVE
jgi:hypothetical protein